MGKMLQEGVTLIELLVTVMVLAVILAAGIPAYQDFIANNRMSAAVNDMVTSIHMARSEAVKRNANITICARNPGTNACSITGNPTSGWIVFLDCTTDPDSADGCGRPTGNIGGRDIIQIHDELPLNVTVDFGYADRSTSAEFQITFGPDGFPVDSDGDRCIDEGICIANLQFCDDRGPEPSFAGTAAGRWVEIGETGRPRIFSAHEDVQDHNPLGGCSYPD